eukprot:scaffold24768_cov146-Isochrysis_galbana.AAC.4
MDMRLTCGRTGGQERLVVVVVGDEELRADERGGPRGTREASAAGVCEYGGLFRPTARCTRVAQLLHNI